MPTDLKTARHRRLHRALSGAALWALVVAGLPAALAAQGAQPPFGILRGSLPEVDLLAGGQPTAEQLSQLAQAGYKTLLDLRSADEDRGFAEEATARALGLTYLAVPVNGSTLRQDETYRRVFEALENAPRPLLMHCASSNRVGALYYAYLVHEKGIDEATARRRAEEAGLRSPQLLETVESWLDRQAVTPP